MQRVFVVDKRRHALMPCHPARARELLNKGKAKVLRMYPFTIILKYVVEAKNQPVRVKIDPGSRTTGIAIVATFARRGQVVIWAAELTHRGQSIRDNLLKRRQSRRTRRSRKTRYRQPRFLNRARSPGWLPPSLMSRINNILTWLNRLDRYICITSLSMELVRFDTQLMQNAEISGVEYQQGELAGYEVREYLLEKWGRKCAYCGIVHVPLEVEHIVPKDRGGSHRVSNLTLACKECNKKKGTLTAAEFGFPHIQAQAKKPLKDAAAINATRWKLYEALQASGLPLEVGTGGRTKFNCVQQAYPKAHWTDAACVGESGERIFIHNNLRPLTIAATRRQARQMCLMNKHGFPRTSAKQRRMNFGFQTGDLVRAEVPSGVAAGIHVGRVAVRARKSFGLNGYDINPDYMRLLHRADGYTYGFAG